MLRSFTATLDEVARADHIDAVFDLKWAPAQHSASLTSAADGSPVAMLAMAGTSGEVSLHRCTADSVQCVAKVLHAPHPAQLHPAAPVVSTSPSRRLSSVAKSRWPQGETGHRGRSYDGVP